MRASGNVRIECLGQPHVGGFPGDVCDSRVRDRHNRVGGGEYDALVREFVEGLSWCAGAQPLGHEPIANLKYTGPVGESQDEGQPVQE